MEQSCPGDGIGRRASLRGMCPYGRAGSTPVLGTIGKKRANFY